MTEKPPVVTKADYRALIGIAIVVGAAVLVAVGLALDSGIPPNSGVRPRGSFFFEYQGLIGGFLAVTGALITVYFLRRQIHSAEKAAERARRINLAALNRPLVDRLDRFEDEVRGIESAVKDTNASRLLVTDGHLDTLRRSLGPELGVLQSIRDHRSRARRTLREVRTAWQNPEPQPQGLGNFKAARMEAGKSIDALRTVVRRTARRLAEGWTVQELAKRSAAEITTLRSPDGV